MPILVGVPEITPVGDSFRPGGSGFEPVANDQVYDRLPPEAFRVVEYLAPILPEATVLVVIWRVPSSRETSPETLVAPQIEPAAPISTGTVAD